MGDEDIEVTDEDRLVALMAEIIALYPADRATDLTPARMLALLYLYDCWCAWQGKPELMSPLEWWLNDDLIGRLGEKVLVY